MTDTDEKPISESLPLPDNVFEDIIGHEDVKELLRAALLVEKPVHVLLAGPSALAKSLFLWDIERAAGEQAVWLIGSEPGCERCSQGGTFEPATGHREGGRSTLDLREGVCQLQSAAQNTLHSGDCQRPLLN